MLTCTAGGGSTPLTCKSGYSKIGTACTVCKVSGCMACTSSADLCTTCNSGYSKSADSKTCGACSDGCAECSSKCARGCTKCVDTKKTAPNCGCGTGETWNA